ncbi:hypothetical protein A2110_01715 [Candidatus Jorgensenbacteria bacterium GWA1_54_12]|uniref:Antitoxin, RHH family protein n=1 Tax=Candidatus Jorgensenbacteria bacterium GWA1_54_12 TaxID=1798468 RepID=A0A1F6BKF7_9BACT|nr:MAG: hypothetical protein A2110_01715 [Candidatus Jorgensenbacteria bacterium GWA1_54_12]
MPTTKKRLNITLSPELERAIAALAKRDVLPQAQKATELLKIALEIEEDRVWDDIAQRRDRKAQFVSHENAWQ